MGKYPCNVGNSNSIRTTLSPRRSSNSSENLFSLACGNTLSKTKKVSTKPKKDKKDTNSCLYMFKDIGNIGFDI